MNRSTPTPSLDHEASRSKVCVICLRKSSGKDACSEQIEIIKSSTNLFKSIQPWDPRVPKGLCKSCDADLMKIKGKLERTSTYV